VIRLFCFTLFVAIVLSAMRSAYADAPSGHQVFTKWCAPCHSRGPGNPGTTALAAVYRNTKPAALEDRTDLTVDFIRQAVRNGVFIMPFFRKTEISDAELEALAAYLSQPAKGQ
jgi:mono/diheme cytochrome c family protein